MVHAREGTRESGAGRPPESHLDCVPVTNAFTGRYKPLTPAAPGRPPRKALRRVSAAPCHGRAAPGVGGRLAMRVGGSMHRTSQWRRPISRLRSRVISGHTSSQSCRSGLCAWAVGGSRTTQPTNGDGRVLRFRYWCSRRRNYFHHRDRGDHRDFHSARLRTGSVHIRLSHSVIADRADHKAHIT